ncbi:actin-binding protein WASF1-like [Bolinopsis microptera]|uniref:actin-binding protein WASF1-like n=1 Tax=Bolinopsis microptera TaxID=2820187 RepID=UPI003079802E
MGSTGRLQQSHKLNYTSKNNDSYMGFVGAIRLLSYLAADADEMFGGLIEEASRTAIKARNMERRVQTLADTISQRQHYVYKTDLNNHNMEVGKFRPNTVVDQNVVIKDNRTPCVKERHSAADLTPALIVFKNVREDGKDCTTLYTDPHYFGRVWFNQMQKAFEANKRARTKKKNKKQNVKKEPRPVIIKEYKVDALAFQLMKIV